MSLAETKDTGRRGGDAKLLFGQAGSDVSSRRLDTRARGPGGRSGLQEALWPPAVRQKAQKVLTLHEK